MAIKPTTEYKWAIDAAALKTQPTDALKNFGWTTANGMITGTPQKPLLQYENGWRNNVYQWLSYLEQKTDETIGVPTTGQTANYFLKTNGSSVFTWTSILQAPTAGQVADYFLKTDGSSGLSWEAVRQVPANSTSGNILAMTSGSTYDWVTLTSLFTSGTHTTTVTTGSGSITLSTSGNNNKIIWYKIGDVVFFSARLVVSARSTPSGSISFSLPSTANNQTAVAISSDLLGSTIDYGLQARTNAGTTQVQVYKFYSGDTDPNIADQIFVNSVIYLAGQYIQS